MTRRGIGQDCRPRRPTASSTDFPRGLLYQRTDAMQPVDLYLSYPAPAPAWDNIYAGYPGGDSVPSPARRPRGTSNYKFALPVSGGVLDPQSKVNYTQNWNLTFEQQLPSEIAFSLAYVGNRGSHIMGSRQFNPAVFAPGATVGNENARRLYPGLGSGGAGPILRILELSTRCRPA